LRLYVGLCCKTKMGAYMSQTAIHHHNIDYPPILPVGGWLVHRQSAGHRHAWYRIESRVHTVQTFNSTRMWEEENAGRNERWRRRRREDLYEIKLRMHTLHSLTRTHTHTHTHKQVRARLLWWKYIHSLWVMMSFSTCRVCCYGQVRYICLACRLEEVHIDGHNAPALVVEA